MEPQNNSRILAAELVGTLVLMLGGPGVAILLPTLGLLPSGDASTGAVHSTRGVVKSIDAMVLVLTRSRHRAELTLSLSPSVHREGTIAPGATVSVRYRDVGGEHVAIAIAVTRSQEPSG